MAACLYLKIDLMAKRWAARLTVNGRRPDFGLASVARQTGVRRVLDPQI